MMRSSACRSSLELVRNRERANRLLRRISPLVQHYDGSDVNDALIRFTTENTFVDCIFPLQIILLL